ncbi:autotransporter domain-containing protein [Sphingomonas suaedae]|uniref:Autotransporter domain-containing protein n=1 Tax=Sphingomonas suaedae TaxID=2599297 RepID=A0A518RGR2_9SPHN|nr:autotransporter domain-containing protein [Sphingomonas suaedae]QDX26648.1 autotransporter domain-containing protein [Sphingomonas suaedae]
MNFARKTRTSLLLSAAGFGLCAITAPAFGAEGDLPIQRLTLLDSEEALREAQSGGATIGIQPGEHIIAQPAAQTIKVERVDPQIVIGYPGTPTTARDPVNITGVGQMIVDQGGGFIGLCTGTLINPRTVIFAAHCVNGNAASDYGANSGGIAIGFGFEANTRANAPGETDELVRWLLGGPGGAGQFQTNTAQAFYNANAVAYNPLSLEPDAASFLYGDVALASLDTPAEGIPTWALLFSPLPVTQGGANGTGYHVDITGYGRNGTGDTGSIGTDYRRRAAENMLGALASIDDFESFIFGGASGLPQNLYWIDFDDPRRGTGTADPRDFNAWRDNPTPNEGITASGDSGGPLILDNTFARQVVIGVLSGGYTRFFNGAPANGYGTASFYQPLYLYWDWIAANNPYRYVTNIAGDRNWNDSANWVSTVDPNYQIIGPNGELINGVPGMTGEQNTGTDGKFGEACFESGGVSECYNYATDTYTLDFRPIGTAGAGNASNSADTAAVGTLASGAATGFVDPTQPEAQAAAEPIPAATIDNGLPGATDFVPNNSDGDRVNGVLPRYFDVTLAAAGTTTLDTAVVVDRFTLAGVQAGLNITSTGSLTSLMDVTQMIGTLNVDGVLSAPSDFLIMAGGLSGTGQINAPYTTSVAGVIAPGTATTVGTLTFNGNLILASGTSYIVNLANGTSDLIAVKQVNGENGIANVGGGLSVRFTNALRAEQTYTILTAEGGVTGAFADPSAISAILTPTLSYSDTAVELTIVAGDYTDVVPSSNPVAFAYAQLLDANRSQAGNYDGFYGPLDLQDASTIVGTLGSLAPASETTALTLGIVSTDANSTFIRNRMNGLDPANLGGTLARYGQPVQVAALNLNPMGSNPVRTDMAAPMQVQEGALPETMSAFVSGGYLTGDGRAMTGMGGRDQYDGWYVGGGIETALSDSAMIGFALTYTDTDGTASFPGQTAKGEALQGTLYGKLNAGGATLDAQVTAGALGATTERTVSFLGTGYTLRAKDSALIVGGEVGVGFDLGNDSFEVAPRIAGRVTHIGFGSALEEGGPMALDYQRESFNSYQGRAGVTFAGRSATVRPFVTATYVHEFNDRAASVNANLVGGLGNGVAFALNGQDKDWAEVSGGLTFRTGAVDLSVSADTTIARDDLSAQTYRGSVTFRF